MEADETRSGRVAGLHGFWSAAFQRLSKFSRGGIWRREPRRLRLCETLSLGNRGFLAVVRYQEQQFLVGGTSTSIALLAQLSLPRDAENDSAEDEHPAA